MVTYRLLSGMLSAKNQAYPSKPAWNAHLESLYHLQLGTGLSTFQDRFEFSFKMRHVAPDMVEYPTLYGEAAKALLTALNQPLLDEKGLAQEKAFLKDEWATKRASKGFKAAQHLTQNLLHDHPYYSPQVTTDDAIDAVTLNDVQTAYDTLMNAPRVLIRLGKGPFPDAKELLHALPQPSASLSFDPPLKYPYTPTSIEPQEDAMKQTLMYDLYATHLTHQDDDYVPLMVLNQLLGGDSESMLFKTIRETHNMAYSVGSSLLSQYGLLLINGAISPENQAGYQREVDTILTALKTGDYPDVRLALAKQSRIETIKRNHDAKSALTRRAFYAAYLDEPFEKHALIKTIEAVDKTDITRVARRLEAITSFQYGARA